MPNDLSHERMRWRTMTDRQLRTRLNKITDRQKLENFIRVAEERGVEYLQHEAILRMGDLFGAGTILRYLPPDGRDRFTRAIPREFQRTSVTMTAPPEVVMQEEEDRDTYIDSRQREAIRRAMQMGVRVEKEVTFCELHQKKMKRRETERTYYCEICEKRAGLRVINLKKKDVQATVESSPEPSFISASRKAINKLKKGE